MKYTLLSSCLMLCSLNAHAIIVADLEDATNGGSFFAQIAIVDAGADTVTINADIADPINPGLTQGDILSLWFNLSDFSGLGSTASLSNISVNGSPLGGSEFFSGAQLLFGQDAYDANALGGNSNLGGTGTSAWDLVVETGENGAASGFIQNLTFDLTIAGLEEILFNEQEFGMRVQSIEGAELFMGGSSKLLGDGDEFETPDPNVGTIPEPAPLSLFGLALVGFGLLKRKKS